MNAEQALRAILKIVQDYLPPDGPFTAKEAMSAIIAVIDPWPLIEPDLLETSPVIDPSLLEVGKS
jgi:hypothetical protein